jgi:hypothetical protein
MTEAEWFATKDIKKLLKFLRDRISSRKAQLYLCGGCRQIAHLLYDEASVEMVDVGERFADGQATEEELWRANWSAECPTFGYDFDFEFWERHKEPRILQERQRTLTGVPQEKRTQG